MTWSFGESWAVAEGCHPVLQGYWSELYNAYLERILWLTVLQAQIDSGVATPPHAYQAYVDTLDVIDLDWVKARERITRHDIKARIEHYNDVAGYEVIHRGLTSHDIVDNTNLCKIRQSLLLLGHTWKRLALVDVGSLVQLRGLRGPVGTAQDLFDLMGADGLHLAETRLRQAFGFNSQWESIGQIYPRSADLVWVDEVIADLIRLGAPDRTQWFAALTGFATMLRATAGDQWNEGDVSASVTRRVALPGVFFSADKAYRDLFEC